MYPPPITHKLQANNVFPEWHINTIFKCIIRESPALENDSTPVLDFGLFFYDDEYNCLLLIGLASQSQIMIICYIRMIGVKDCF